MTGNCSGDSSDQKVAVGSESSATNALAAGSYSYKADYSGDDNYNGSTGACEPFTVSKTDPTVTTVIHDANHDAIGPEILVDSVHDSATVSGNQNFIPTGTVNFTVFSNYSCRGEDNSAGTDVALDGNGVADPSQTVGPLSAGLYSFQAHYNGDSNYNGATSGCEPFSLTTLDVIKHVASGDATASDFSLHVKSNGTDVNGSPAAGSETGTLYLLTSGSYVVSEDAVSGYTPSFSNGCLEGDVTLAAGDAKTCTITNTRDTGTVEVHKKVDDGSGRYATGDTGANTLGFRWGLDSGDNNRLMGTDATITTGDKHSVTENGLAGYVFTGWYETNNEDFSCQNPESTTLPISFTVTKNNTRSFTLCNQLQNPVLTITKANDAVGDKAPGDAVMFTLTVTATQSGVNNVTVTDLPAGGFHYRSGTGMVSKNGGPTTPATFAHAYASPGVWDLGNMNVGDVFTLTYIADIDGSEQAGLYTDLAWAQGKSLANADVLANAQNPGFVNENFVGTQVNIVKENQSTTTITGQVLGASTSLPATGGKTAWIILATLLLLSGMGLVYYGLKKNHA